MLIFHKKKTLDSTHRFLVQQKSKILLLKSLNGIQFRNLDLLFPIIFSSNILFIKNLFDKRRQLAFFLNSAKQILKGANQFYFFEFKIIGLGYKIFKVKTNFSSKIISMKLGFAHYIRYFVSKNLRLITGKRKFFFYTNDWQTLNNTCKHFFFLKKLNSYKLKGLVPAKGAIKLKTKQKK